MRLAVTATLLLALVSAAPAWGQSRAITYTEVSRRVDSIYLAHPNGSGKVLLHRATNINGPSINPARPQVAYWNSNCSCIELVTYADGVSGATVASVERVAPGGKIPSFSPDGNTLVYTWTGASTQQIRWLSLVDGSSGTLVEGVYANDFAWAAADRLIYTTFAGEIVENLIDLATMQVTASSLVYKAANIEGIGAARNRNHLFFGESSGGSIAIQQMDLGAAGTLGDNVRVRSNIVRGSQPIVSPDDAFLLYRAEPQGELRRISLTTGAVTTLTKSPSYRQHDWRR